MAAYEITLDQVNEVNLHISNVHEAALTLNHLMADLLHSNDLDPRVKEDLRSIGWLHALIIEFAGSADEVISAVRKEKGNG
jgi:hypothetical protein